MFIMVVDGTCKKQIIMLNIKVVLNSSCPTSLYMCILVKCFSWFKRSWHLFMKSQVYQLLINPFQCAWKKTGDYTFINCLGGRYGEGIKKINKKLEEGYI